MEPQTLTRNGAKPALDDVPYLSAQDILGLDDTQIEDVDMRPFWPGKVRMRGMTGNGRDRYEREMVELKDGAPVIRMRHIRATLVQRCAIKPDGSPLFTIEQVENLGSRSARALDRLFNVAKRLSGIGEKDIEELGGNSGDGPSAD